jgi:sugar lactone lactonase YvrE
MSSMPSKFSAKYSAWKCKLSFSVLTFVFCASGAWAAVPSVVIDSQQTLGGGYFQPQSLAVNGTNQNAVFIADTGNNQLAVLFEGVSIPFQPPGFTLSNPQAVALDAKGDLFVGDSPSGVGRVIELPADSNGNLTGTAQLVFTGAPLTDPISLAVDSAGTLFIGDYPPDTEQGVIYSLAAGGTTPQLLNITGLPSTLTPASLLRDSLNNLYIADNGNAQGSGGGVYIAPATGGAAQPVATQSFALFEPSGLALNPAGDLYILSQLGNGTGFNAGSQVIVIPAASPTTPYILPNTGNGISSSMGRDLTGNIDLLTLVAGSVVQLTSSPIDMGSTAVGQSGSPFLFNFEFNSPATLGGFQPVTQGDNSAELVNVGGGSCINGPHNNLPGGGPTVSPYFPYTCSESYKGSPRFPGTRNSAILVQGSGSTILASAPAYQFGLAGAEVTYPLNAATTATNLLQPQAIAISGLNRQVFVADTQAAKVYSISGLGGTTLTPVSTGAITLQGPSALALDGSGNLFIADFDLGEVIEVPITGQAPFVVNTGSLLQHPIAMAFDYLGDLYIGDAGSGGMSASSSNPGYVVKLPVGGTAFKFPVPGVPIVFPQALATDLYTNVVVIGDGGDLSGVGQVVYVLPDGSLAGTTPIDGVVDPTGLAFDPAETLYVLDGVANTVTVIPQNGSTPSLLPFDNSSLSGASALAISAGGQSFLIANVGQGSSNSLLRLNGNRSALDFGNVNVGNQGQPMTATETNIGNLDLTLQSINGAAAPFSILGSSTCAPGVSLFSSTSCSINAQFSPTSVGSTSDQITVDSDGYNSGVPILTLRGTGR